MTQLGSELVAAYTRLDTCIVANAIETFEVRLRNEGFADASIRCLFDGLPPVIGHAVTARIKTSAPPPVGHSYYDRTDWWNYIATVPAPRLVVVEDVDERPGVGAFLGEIHANILKALGCVGYATNGSVRDLGAVCLLGFQLFAAAPSVSHAFAHIVEFGKPVTLGGLPVASGDVVYGDRHGLLTIPDAILDRVPEAAVRMRGAEQPVIDLCQSPEFSLATLRTLVRQLG